jgi:antirestriction protein ArdC
MEGSMFKTDVQEKLTNTIIEQMEKMNEGEKWHAPWHGAFQIPKSISTGQNYNGLNVILLWISAQNNNYKSNVWGTYEAWTQKNAHVAKGQKGTTVFYWKRFEKKNPETNDYYSPPEYGFFAKAFTVFNREQVENYEDKNETDPNLSENERIDNAEAFFNNVPAEVLHGGNRAFYSPSDDKIRLPDFTSFHNAVAYYGTRAHETVHWTGASNRLNREFGKRFGDASYAFEELVAELGAAFLCAQLNIENHPREDHARYLSSWLKVLKNDKKAIFTAAKHAQAAVNYIASNNVENDIEMAA